MSNQTDPKVLAQRAERDLNSYAAKTGHQGSTTAEESGVDASATSKFAGSSVTYGSAASGAGDNREIPVEEGGDLGKDGRPTKARDFEGAGGPETKADLAREERPGDDGVDTNVRS
ncbi:MAG: hypothetical protein M1817_002336 [Caeruleum heppii]|nr:MAG: hypothetical protein M1817_003479 [Caeruleum heppii]KAI9673698.1 MAG: hypothetical protein M1817_002336 [Caeruleum heppii]